MPDEADMTFTCAACGKPFEAGPDSFVQIGFSPECGCTCGGECGCEPLDVEQGPDGFTPEELAAMDEFQLRAIGLTPELRDKLLNAQPGDMIDTGAIAMCPDCQAKLFGPDDGGFTRFGRRVDVEPHELKPGEFGKAPNGAWHCCPVAGLRANLSGHTVTEHEDGTITVAPSILVRNSRMEWHGYLIRGEFKPCD